MKFQLIGTCLGAALGAPALLAAQSAELPAAQQIQAAVAAAPAELRDGAAVMGFKGKALVPLREGKNDMVCLADDPAIEKFHVACYHKGLEPFMARGRSLRAEGVKDPMRDSVRFKEIVSGKLKMPSTPSALYTLSGPEGSFDPATGKVTGASWLYVVYIPGATLASTGISERPAKGAPWIMFPGTPKAHIMFTPSM
ncbi:MAG TPA: hypothetical protein VM076_19650 [Gemmatimonadaceae bacterium]|nr:hypothetical protein [Gemmatimonadaceae bacterium]